MGGERFVVGRVCALTYSTTCDCAEASSPQRRAQVPVEMQLSLAPAMTGDQAWRIALAEKARLLRRIARGV